MVHVDAGTANSAMAMHNARRGRLPLVLMAGKAPYTVRGRIAGLARQLRALHPGAFDQAGIVRPYAKWEWTLPSGVMTKETLRRAHSVAHSDPMGPVYLMLPRETLTQTWTRRRCARSRGSATARCPPARRCSRRRADRGEAAFREAPGHGHFLRRAQSRGAGADRGGRAHGGNPRVRSGPALSQHLARLALLCRNDAAIAEADVGLLVDVDVPWIPKHTKENPQTWWAHIDVDVVKECFPIWASPRTRACRATAC